MALVQTANTERSVISYKKRTNKTWLRTVTVDENGQMWFELSR